MLTSMELRHLRYFVAVAETENVTRAAVRLNLSQPALSRQIHDLEAELKVALFERKGRNLRLTAAGEALLAQGQRVLDEAGAFRERARAIGGGEVGILRAGATPQSLQRLFPTMLRRFRRVMPGVEVRLTEGDSNALIGALRRDELDLAFTSYQPEFGAASLPAGAVSLVALTEGRGRPRKGAIEVGELEDEPLLLLQRGYGSRDLFDAVCRVARIRVNIFLESDASGTLMALAGAGCGIAVLPTTVPLPVRGVSVHQLTHGGRVLEVQTAVHWNARRLLPPYAKRFAAELAELARREFSRPAIQR